MAKPPLSMKPTGWFQIAWSDEISVGDANRVAFDDILLNTDIDRSAD